MRVARERNSLDHDEDIALDWATMGRRLPTLEAASQARLLDLLTVSCVFGSRIHRDQTALPRSACHYCGAILHKARLKNLLQTLKRGHEVTVKVLSATRSIVDQPQTCPLTRVRAIR